MRTLKIMSGGEILFPACHVADNFLTKGRGLLFREEDYCHDGLLLYNNNSIHMIGMKYPITCVALDKHLIVRQVKLVRAGFHFLVDFRAKHILECHQDQYNRLVLALGSKFSIASN